MGVAALAGGALLGRLSVPGTDANGGMDPARVADCIHDVIEADRTVYAQKVVNRLQFTEKIIDASEHWEEEKELPLPAQMLRMGAQLVADKKHFRYALISDFAINKANLPKNEVERAGVEAVRARPEAPHRGTWEAGGKRFFVSVYPDKAVANACVQCHNAHEHSPKRDWKPGDVMGAVVVSLPLD